MKKVLIFGCFCLLLTGCVTAPKPLYSWGDYQEKTYAYTKDATDKSLDDLLNTYQKLIDTQTGTRKTVPPGLCADYGYLLYKQGKTQEGLALLEKEIALYPESSVFIARIIKNLQK
ncbi:lipoprotein [Bacteroidia bacterium]|nr:lipoprotein [Bacteroidia bacterium]